jgi:hypothetical protein
MIVAARVTDTKDSVDIRTYSIPFTKCSAGREGDPIPTFQHQPSAAVRSDCDKFTLWVRVLRGIPGLQDTRSSRAAR